MLSHVTYLPFSMSLRLPIVSQRIVGRFNATASGWPKAPHFAITPGFEFLERTGAVP